MGSERAPRRPRLSLEGRVLLLALVAGAFGGVTALLLLWLGDYSSRTQWTLTLLVVVGWLSFALAARERVIRPVQTISNMLAALREGDFSIRARGADPDDTLGLALLEVNTLGETLRGQRLGALEATALMRTVMEEIEVAVFAFDDAHRLVLANRSGERLLDQPLERLRGRTAEALGLATCLEGDANRTLDVRFPGSAGRWQLRRSVFRQGGRPHQLLVLSDLSKALRDEERLAWQRLIRVLGHEINNSLAPIKSIAASLQTLAAVAEMRGPDWEDDLRQGLSVIGGRAESLSRFMQSYAQLARLPSPTRRPVDVEEWVRRVAQLEQRLHVHVEPGAPATIQADGDQLDQLLINVVRNAVDASIETDGRVSVGWSRNGTVLDVWVRDEGLGLSNTANLFVPFFTTKPNGTGIGLALSRQIAEAHGGTLTLSNRRDVAHGCEARLRLPLP